MGASLLIVAIGTLLWFAFKVHRAIYTIDAPQSPEVVMHATAGLDLAAQPGSSGSDPGRSGGTVSAVRFASSDRDQTWTVISGQKVAATLHAHFDPVDDGRRTRITFDVQRGEAAAAQTPPLYRSVELTTSLFRVALEDAVAQSVPRDASTCNKLLPTIDTASDDELLELQKQLAPPSTFAGRIGSGIERTFHRTWNRLRTATGYDRASGDYAAAKQMVASARQISEARGQYRQLQLAGCVPPPSEHACEFRVPGPDGRRCADSARAIAIGFKMPSAVMR